MARLKCKCGNSLSNSIDFATDIYYIFSKKEILEAIKKNAQLLYWDFYIDREPECDYWYCSRCKRMMECSKEKHRVERIYKPVRLSEENSAIDTSSWQEFYSFSDNELLALTDKNYANGYKMTLKEFYEKYPRKYFYRISPDNSTIYAYESVSGKPAFAYGREEWTPIDPMAV
jgi:hypothetical protein